MMMDPIVAKIFYPSDVAPTLKEVHAAVDTYIDIATFHDSRPDDEVEAVQAALSAARAYSRLAAVLEACAAYFDVLAHGDIPAEDFRVLSLKARVALEKARACATTSAHRTIEAELRFYFMS